MTLGRLLVRLATAADSDEVWPLARDFATSFAPKRAAFDRAFSELISAPHTLLAVAVDDQFGLAGYLLANSHMTFLANGPVTWVEEVMVNAQARRTGVGTGLMAFAEHWSASIGAAYIALASRRAGDFYLALGYEDSAVFYRKTL